MSQKERTGQRSLLYSRWHRTDSIKRYLGPAMAWKLEMIDVDSLESCAVCHAPLALVETQVSDRPPKNARILTELAKAARIPAWSVSCVPGDLDEIALFRAQPLAPVPGPPQDFLPRAWAFLLWSLRVNHTRQTQCPVALGQEAKGGA